LPGVTPAIAGQPRLEAPAQVRSKKKTPSRDPYPFAPAFQALALFALVGASLGLMFVSWATLSEPAMLGFLDQNTLSKSGRLVMFIGLAAGGALAAILCAVLLAALGRRGVPGVRRAAEVLLPLGFAGALPSLFSARPWHSKPLTFLVGLTICVLVFERALRRSQHALPEAIGRFFSASFLQKKHVARWLPVAVVLAGCVAYTWYFSYYTILHHRRLGTAAYDLGININWAYNAAHGNFARSSIVHPFGGNYFGVHAVVAMLSWVPWVVLSPSGEGLLIYQAAMAGFAAATLYLFAQTQIPRWSAVVVAYVYLLYAPLHGPNFYDFHELMPPLFFHYLLYWAIVREKKWLVALLVVVLWTHREDVTIALAVLGVFLMITGLRPRMGAVIAVTSGIYFVLVKLVIMPKLWAGWFDTIYKDLQAGERGFGIVIQTILTNPAYFLTTLLKEDKLIYFLHMFTPVALLPARRWSLLLLALPGFAFSLLTTGYWPTLSIAFQYTCHAIPYVFAAAVLMLRVLGRGADGIVRRRAALGAMLFGVLAHSYVFGAVLQHETFVGGFSKIQFEMSDKDQKRYRTLQRLVAMIPESASVAASENEVPHVSYRASVYTLRDVAVHTDYALLNARAGDIGAARKNFEVMLARSDYGLLGKGDDLYLFKRGHVSPDTAAALKALHVDNKRRK
jgi:uncharacterized membrane protein